MKGICIENKGENKIISIHKFTDIKEKKVKIVVLKKLQKRRRVYSRNNSHLRTLKGNEITKDEEERLAFKKVAASQHLRLQDNLAKPNFSYVALDLLNQFQNQLKTQLDILMTKRTPQQKQLRMQKNLPMIAPVKPEPPNAIVSPYPFLSIAISRSETVQDFLRFKEKKKARCN